VAAVKTGFRHVDLDGVTMPGQDDHFFATAPSAATPPAPVFPTRAGYAPMPPPVSGPARSSGPSRTALVATALGLVAVIGIVVGFVALAHKDKHTQGDAVLRPIQQANNVQLDSALRQAAIAEEAYVTEHGTYTTDLSGAGYANSTVQVIVVSATASDYCLQATTPQAAAPEYHSKSGGFSGTPCR
jgi:hypothetical protein